MTVTSDQSRQTYLGSAGSSTSSFSVSFYIQSADQLTVTETDAGGLVRTLTLNTDYTITNTRAYVGWVVNLIDPIERTPLPLTAGSLTLQRVPALTQDIDLRNQGSYFAEVQEDALDYLTIIAQWLRDQIVDMGGRITAMTTQIVQGIQLFGATSGSTTFTTDPIAGNGTVNFPAAIGTQTVLYKSGAASQITDSAPGGPTLSQHQFNLMNVTAVMFGADPTGVSDSTAAFNEAIEYLVSLGLGSGGGASTNFVGGSLSAGAFGATFKILGTVLVPSGLEIDLQGANMVGSGYLLANNTCFMSAAAVNGYVVGNQLMITSGLISGGVLPQGALVVVPGYNASILTITAISNLVLAGGIHGAGSGSVCTLSASIGNLGTAGTPLTILAGTQSAASAGSSSVAAVCAGYSTAAPLMVPSFQGAIKIRNGSFSNFACALGLYGCLDTCIFSTIKYYNCLYSFYAVQCYYSCFHNHMTRCSAAAPWTTTATNAAYHFEGAINVEEIDSLFCGGRILGYEFWSSNQGICVSIRNCSCEQGVNGFYFSGLAQKIVFRDCYIEGMSGLIFDFTHQGSSTPAYILDIDGCFFNFCLGTILNAIWTPNLRWGKCNFIAGSPLPASIAYLNDNTTSGGEVNVTDSQIFDNALGGIGTISITAGVATVSSYPGSGIQVGTSFYGPNLTALVTVSGMTGTGTGGNGTYPVTGMTTAASGPLGLALMPTAPPMFTFNPAGQTTKMLVKGRSLINSMTNYNQLEVAANSPGLTNAPIPFNFFGTSGYVPGAVPFCSMFTTGSGTSRSVTIDTRIAYNLPNGNPDKYLMGVFNLIICCSDNLYPLTGTIMGRFSATAAMVDTPASGYTVAVSNFNGFVRLTITGSAFLANGATVAWVEGIVKILS